MDTGAQKIQICPELQHFCDFIQFSFLPVLPSFLLFFTIFPVSSSHLFPFSYCRSSIFPTPALPIFSFRLVLFPSIFYSFLFSPLSIILSSLSPPLCAPFLLPFHLSPPFSFSHSFAGPFPSPLLPFSFLPSYSFKPTYSPLVPKSTEGV